MTLATLTTRFVFPQLSLEGRRLWILGMAPIGLKRILWQKFALSSMASMAVTFLLTMISCSMLRVAPAIYAMSLGTVLFASLGLSGLAVGLGAIYPDFSQESSARIVSGFGGTLCLLLSLFYVTVLVGFQAIPMHYQITRHLFSESEFVRLLAVIWGTMAMLTAGCVLIPMTLAGRALAVREIPHGR